MKNVGLAFGSGNAVSVPTWFIAIILLFAVIGIYEMYKSFKESVD
ncbi:MULTISPECIES: hypothetical protein [Paenibacillus]|uniref:Uncharacterized protein n=1 Tax=Paenibacillus vandeheii TaxID=3035917 RepID=A0ABT8JFY8_9BACL|nr:MULTISPECIES: hypothetical protein [Paenibacillus]MDN4604028.1 hypothetical protein [Paenibacillus vandeheii]